MEITGRIVKDAVVTQLKDERTVTNFTIVINDYYKSKNAEAGKQLATYFNCSYWMKSAIAQYLKKGTLVELGGRVGLQTYTSKEGEAKAVLTFHVNNIKLHGAAKGGQEAFAPQAGQGKATTAPAGEITEPADDLPF